MSLKKDQLVSMYESHRNSFSEEFMNNILKKTGRGGVSASRDYIRANRLVALLKDSVREHPELAQDFSLLKSEEDARPLIHPAIWFRHNFNSVNLCARYDELKPAQQDELFESSDWVASEKMNGNRGWLVVYNMPGMWEPKICLFSRNYSDVDCSLCEYGDHIFQDIKAPANIIFAIDVEIMYEGNLEWLQEMNLVAETQLQATSSMLQMNAPQSLEIQALYKQRFGEDFFTFRVIHPLYYNKKNYTKRPLGEGISVYDEVVSFAQSLGINAKPIYRCDGSRSEKQAMLDSILERRGEGIVFWNRKGYYTASENRDKTSWVKLKRSVSQTLSKEGLGDSIDGFITGFTKSSEDKGRSHLIGGFEVSIYMMNPDGRSIKHHIASVPGLSVEMAEQATILDEDGKPTLNPEFLGLVLEVDGQAISSKSLRLTHPRMVRVRFDKTPEDCIYTREFIESQVM